MTATATVAHHQRAGDQALAFEALYRACVDDVHAYAALLLRDRSAAEEVTATAFERAFRRRAAYEPERGSERAWLFGIARNAALDELRRRRRTTALDDDPVAQHGDPGAAAELAAQRATVAAGLRTLEPRDRELIALRFHAGLERAEIAAVLGVSPTNASTRLHRALTRLREACHDPS